MSLDPVAIALDVVAIGAVLVFTSLCLILSRGLFGSGLRRGFVLAAIAGFVQLIGTSTQFAVDLGFDASRIPANLLSAVDVLFLVLMALAVQSFFPVWFRSFRNENVTPSQPREDAGFHQGPPSPGPTQDVQAPKP